MVTAKIINVYDEFLTCDANKYWTSLQLADHLMKKSKFKQFILSYSDGERINENEPVDFMRVIKMTAANYPTIMDITLRHRTKNQALLHYEFKVVGNCSVKSIKKLVATVLGKDISVSDIILYDRNTVMTNTSVIGSNNELTYTVKSKRKAILSRLFPCF